MVLAENKKKNRAIPLKEMYRINIGTLILVSVYGYGMYIEWKRGKKLLMAFATTVAEGVRFQK